MGLRGLKMKWFDKKSGIFCLLLSLGLLCFFCHMRLPNLMRDDGGARKGTEKGFCPGPFLAFAQPQRQDPSKTPPAEVRRMGKDQSEMILIPGGAFTMGADGGDREEGPAHQVLLNAFWIDRYEVTNGQYMKFMEATRRRPPATWSIPKLGDEEQPVVGVSWEDAAAYAKWAGKRLPTEAEWEKAARGAGTSSATNLYPWGNRFDEKKVNSAESALGKTTGVRELPEGASPFGVYNMAGNASEWVADWFAPDYYQTSPKENPKGPDTGTWKVVRGGGWWCKSENCQVTHRRKELPTAQTSSIGFRCALDGK
jgi:sulfatase modifying factor 1